ncbi:MAG TPA: menaquinone biosynthesis protein [Vicinamibacterales bacterium]
MSRPPVRIGAVSYLNSRPLVVGLEAYPDRFAVRYDVPSACARLLHARETDVGLIPSIEYLRGDDYRMVPDCAVTSDGPVRSVAIFTSVPMERVTSLALDTSSRTSVALTRVLSKHYFDIRPRLIDHPPVLDEMVRLADGALLIGEPALFADYERLGLEKVDLGQVWKDFTGLPFVYACWTGHPDALTPDDVAMLQDARARGVAGADEVAARFFPDDPVRAAEGAKYLRENIHFRLGPREIAGLERFYELAAATGVVPRTQPLRWYDAPGA